MIQRIVRKALWGLFFCFFENFFVPILTSGGPASFIMPLQIGKTPIVVPRQHQYNEHVNDHQVEFARNVAQRMGTIIPVEDINTLGDVIMNYDQIVAGISKKIWTSLQRKKEAGYAVGNDAQITEKLLKALIMDQLHLFITQLSDRRKVVEELRKIEDVQNPVYRAKGEIMSLTDKISQMAKKREQLYADYVAGVVDSEDYQLIREDYSRQYDGLRAALKEAENKKVKVERQIEEYLDMTAHLEEHLDSFGFDIQLVKSLVQRIEVGADKRIRIVFGFRDVFAELGKESAET